MLVPVKMVADVCLLPELTFQADLEMLRLKEETGEEAADMCVNAKLDSLGIYVRTVRVF